MNIERQLPHNILPCSTQYQSDSQPYYIVAPAYRHQSAGVRLLHELCSLLNQMGFEAYVDASVTSGLLWTPRLTDATKIAHYKAGKTPIVVYPEVVTGLPLELGLPVRYVLNFPGLLGGEKAYTPDELVYTFLDSFYPGAKRLYLPLLDLQAMGMGDAAAAQPVRDIEVAYYHNRYSKGGGKLRDFGPNAFEISSTTPDTNAKTLAVLRRAKILYCYEFSGILVEAALCGCPVVLLPNPITLKELPPTLHEIGMEGVAWGEDPEEVARAVRTVGERKTRYLHDLAGWQSQLQDFVTDTQAQARALPAAKAWPQSTLDKLPFADLSAADIADRADRRKYARLNTQYTRWTSFCTLREIDADIYAEHLTLGRLPALAVLIDQRQGSLDDLADTLDSLAACLGQPASLTIVGTEPVPEALAGDSNIVWQVVPEGQALDADSAGLAAHWLLLLKSGTRVAPQALMEFALATQEHATADLIYADDDTWVGDTPRSYPYFKPDANTELLRCTNYLGNALLVQSQSWRQAGCPLLGAGTYGFALQRLQQRGRVALGHIDTVLSHGNGQISAALENQEYLVAQRQLQASGLARRVQPQSRLGTWLVDYQVPADAQVSLVIPTGLQTGYMRCLIESLHKFPQTHLAEIVLVSAPEHLAEVEFALADVARDTPIHIVTVAGGEYNHAAALNAGVAAARSAYVLVCDDDTEMLHADWLAPLLGIAAQADVGCVGPRLMANRGTDARVVGGPLVLGVQGTAVPYIGEEGRLEEAGVFSRLQLTQDVGTVAGHCFLFRRSLWAEAGGFDEKVFSLWFPVLDFCLRLAQQGQRHVWTPLTSVLHHGGRSVASVVRDTRAQLRWAERELTEKEALLARWSRQLANDRCYNRHLSLHAPFDIDADIVVDWNPRRRERPRLLAAPLTSGAGQYRVIEPLDALQNASLAQTCSVMPQRRGVTRFLQPLELVRAAPDKLILQHSVDDVHLSMIAKYRALMPGMPIVQMVDDLLGEVPEKHPNRVFQSREGHQRMIQALKQSDELIVTTEPLRDYYKKYVPDVRVVPNTLNKQWLGLNKPAPLRERMRVGWIGAAQHKGDLDLVSDVVRQLAGEVDWVFMGMATDEIRPHLKEFHQFVSISDYPKKMSELDLDIAIAPLEDNIFNACKSNLRLLEYGAMGWPVVCSDVFPYRSDNPPVLRCANGADVWVAALRRLIADRELRQSMGAALNQWVNSHYLLSGRVSQWKECLID